jgi:LacI family transcriptional regulator
MTPTIRDVARLAGVSVGTVSNVLNKVPSVSGQRVERVTSAIAALGYHRNQTASQLRNNISRSIGLVIPDISNPFYPAVARGVEDYASREGYNVFLCNKDRTVEKELAAVDALLSKNVAGILLYKPRLTPAQIFEIGGRCELVLIDSDTDDVECDVINVDDYAGMVALVRRVAALGHRRIAFIAGLPDSFSSMRRFSAFNDVMLEMGIHYPPEYIRRGDFSVASGMKQIEALMKLTEKPTVVLAANDMMAIGAMLWALENGIRVPRDLSIVGYDDTQNASLIRPRLTTVSQPKYELGEESARLLFKRIKARRDGQELEPQRIVMPTHFVEGDSLCTAGA